MKFPHYGPPRKPGIPKEVDRKLRAEAAQDLSRAIAYKNVHKLKDAQYWARRLTELLRAHSILGGD